MAQELSSFTDYTGRILKDEPGFVFTPGAVIDRSCFSQENPDSVIFPADLVVTFHCCNLTNVVIPAGCTVIEAD